MYIHEVISHLNASPQDTCLGVKYDHNKQYVEIYMIYKDNDEESFIGVSYEAGELFSSDGEEGSFSIEEVEQQIQFVDFKLIDMDLVSIGSSSEYVVYSIFPDALPSPDNVFTKEEKMNFANILNGLINS